MNIIDGLAQLGKTVDTQTRQKIAKLSHVGTGTVERVKFIRDNADDETKSKLRSGLLIRVR